MKFLLKVAVIAVAAKYVLSTPTGTTPQLERVTGLTMRDISHHVDTVFSKLEQTIKFILS